MNLNLENYASGSAFDELIDCCGRPRPAAKAILDYLGTLDIAQIHTRRTAVEAAILTMGITFTIYDDGGNIDRAWPFDIVPRVMEFGEWRRIERGLKQRLTALNLFIDDIYNKQSVTKDGIFPAEVLAGSKNFRPQCSGIKPPFGVWAHVCGTDLVRDTDGTVYALEDNLRLPSGVAYMLENRMLMKRLFPEMFELCEILPVDDSRKAVAHPVA